MAAEFGLVTVERADAERAAAEGDRRARTVVDALRELSFQLSGTQLGITITSLVVGMLAEPALAQLLEGPLSVTGLPDGAVPGISVVIGMLLAAAVQMVIGELVPKNWAVSKPLQVARFVAGPQQGFTRVFRPVIGLLNTAANRLVRLFESNRPMSWHPPAHRESWSPSRGTRRRPAPSNRTPRTSSYGRCRSPGSPPST